MDTIEVGELLYEYTARLAGMTEYGVSFEALMAGMAPPPAEGARFDVPFEGASIGPRLKGKVTGRILKFSLFATNGEESVRGELEMAEDDSNTLTGKYYELSDPDKTPIALVCTKIVK